MQLNLYYHQEKLPTVVKTEIVHVHDRGRSLVGGELHTLSDGTYFSRSSYEKSASVLESEGMRLQTYGSAKWYLELCTLTRELV